MRSEIPNIIQHFFTSAQLLRMGFLQATHHWLTDAEKDSLRNGAIYIILEQAIRFLSDYLNDDAYYVVKYKDHNFNRAKNQLRLLDDMLNAF